VSNKLWQSLVNAWKIPDLRAKLLFTAAILAIYRFGVYVQVPGVDAGKIQELVNSGGAGVLGMLDLFSGGALAKFGVFALGIMPYITASIVMQLLTVVIPKLEELAKEGEQGQKVITKYTRLSTVALALVQSVGYIFLFRDQGVLGQFDWVHALLIMVSLTAGATAVMWLGELITARGIGNGMSILIFVSIVSRFPSGINAFIYTMSFVSKIAFVVIALAVIVAVIWITTGERRIPVQYAKRIVGRRMTGGHSTFIPLKVNMAGVIPVIFASSVMMIPATMAQFMPTGGAQWFANAFGPSSFPYIIGEAALIILFTYFYTAVTFNPIDQADNLKKYGGFVPGIRPGRPTAEFLDRVLTRLTLPGALFLAGVAVLPWILFKYMNVQFYFGGTSLLIVVGVALDTMRQMEAQLLMRHYEGFLK
jgi:preprotein translocase subunit SecY